MSEKPHNKWKTHFKVISIFWLIAGIWGINSLYSYQNILQKEEIDYKYGSFDYSFNYRSSDEILPVVQNYSTQVLEGNSDNSDTFFFFYTYLGEETKNHPGSYYSYQGILLDINQRNYLDYVDLAKIDFSSDDQNDQKEEIFHSIYSSPDNIIISQAFALSKGINIADSLNFSTFYYGSFIFRVIGIIKHCPLFDIDSPVDTKNIHFIISNHNNISSVSNKMNFFTKSEIILSPNTIKNDLEETYNLDMENLDFNIGSKYEDQIITKNSLLGKILYLQQYPLFLFLIVFLYIFIKKDFKEFESEFHPIVFIYGGDNVNFIKRFKLDLKITLSIQIILFNLITVLNYFFIQFILNHLLNITIRIGYFEGFADISEKLLTMGWDLQFYGTPLPPIYHIDLILLLFPVFIIILISSMIHKINQWFPNRVQSKKVKIRKNIFGNKMKRNQ